VWVPKSYPNSTGSVSLVFTIHGLGDHCTKWGPSSAFKPVAEANNFLLVYPCGTNGLLGVAWNAGTCCLRGSPIDEVAFFRQMIIDIQTNYPRVNPRRIFATGMSNGAMMTEMLACKAPALFAGMASVAGVVVMEPGLAGGLKSCTTAFAPQNRTLPILFVHGNGDLIVPWTGSVPLGFPDVPSNFKEWSVRHSCTGEPVQTFKKGTFSNQVYQNCRGGITLELVKDEGGSHRWPKTADFDTPSYAWAFFKRIQDSDSDSNSLA
jgi:poly(3-hydroxybutyrate) depolymerase